MESLTSDQIDRLLADIGHVRSAIEKNSHLVRLIDIAESIRPVALLSGIGVFVFCALFLAAIQAFGGYGAVPAALKWALYGSVVIAAVLLGVLKNLNIIRSARAIDPRITMLGLMREYYRLRIYAVFIPIAIVALFVAGYCAATGHARFIVPESSIVAGLGITVVAAMIGVNTLYPAGYWLMAGGMLAIWFNQMPALFVFPLTFGIGLLLIAIPLPRPHRTTGEA